MRLRQFLTLGSLTLVGCAVGPDFESPSPPQTHEYMENPLPSQTVETEGEAGEAQHFVMGGDIPGDWWCLFHSPSINALIEQGIQKNNTLKAAQASLRQAEANYWASVANLFPFVSVSGLAERQRFNGASFDQPNLRPQTFNLFNAGVNVSYTLDVFGGIRRQIEGFGAQEDLARYEERAAFLTLTANIVTTSITEASLRAQIQATEELVKIQKKNLEIAENRFALGAISKIDSLSQATQLYQTESSLPPLQNALAQTRTTLSVLIGELPSDCKIHEFSLSEITLPTEIPVSLPCHLVWQRPDIKAAEATLHAASAQIGVTTANFFPQFTITGNYGGSSNFIKDLFKHNSNVWTLIGNVVQPVFQAGMLIEQRKAAIAAFEAAYAQYRQTLLEAYKNVADVLQALELDAVQLKITTDGEKAATETLKLTQLQYDLGAVSYLNLIIAQRQYHLARVDRIRAEASRLSNTAALFQALGGGWWNYKPACPEQTAEKCEGEEE